MVLESLINPLKGEAHPVRLFFIGFLYCSVALWLSVWIFRDHSSLIAVFLTTMASMPLVYSTVKYEEKKDATNLGEKTLLREHAKALALFMYLFLGVTLACTFWYVVLPADTIKVLFNVQAQTIVDMNPGVQGFAVDTFGDFIRILSNNLKVLIFCILFSFIYGIGALFILNWNASVIGVAIGNFIRTELYKLSQAAGAYNIAAHFNVVSLGLFRYSIHGIPEILSYFVAGLAGGIISTAVIKHDFGTQAYEKIILDSSLLLLLSLSLLVLAAFLEVFVTPPLFELMSQVFGTI
jgi:uncharacterized membrane protein SpoIIM required for sporulation